MLDAVDDVFLDAYKAGTSMQSIRKEKNNRYTTYQGANCLHEVCFHFYSFSSYI